MDAFQHSFNLDKNSPDFSNLQGNIVSVLQVGGSFSVGLGCTLTHYIGRMFLRSHVLILYQRYVRTQKCADYR